MTTQKNESLFHVQHLEYFQN